jgi:hypothetical protein
MVSDDVVKKTSGKGGREQHVGGRRRQRVNQTATSRATWVATTTWLCINLNFNLNKKSGLSIGSMTAMMNKYDSLCTWFNGDRKLTAPDSSGNG